MRDPDEIRRAIQAMDGQMLMNDIRTPEFAMAAVVRDALRWVLQEEGEAFSAALAEYEKEVRRCLN